MSNCSNQKQFGRKKSKQNVEALGSTISASSGSRRKNGAIRRGSSVTNGTSQSQLTKEEKFINETGEEVQVHSDPQYMPEQGKEVDLPELKEENNVETKLKEREVEALNELSSIIERENQNQEESSSHIHTCIPQTQSTQHNSSSSSSLLDMRFHSVANSLRSSRDSPRRGRNVKPQRVSEPSIVGSVAGFVYDSIPQSSSGQNQNERVEWINFQKYENACDPGLRLDVLVLGLSRGFQMWAILENGECEEIVTERQGPLKIGRLLTCNPMPSFGVSDDRFDGIRPLFAIVEANSPIEHPSCTISFLSLVSRQHVHRIVFPTQIITFEESPKAIVVSLSSRFVVCDALSLREQRCIYYPNGLAVNNTFAMSDIFLAFADSSFIQSWQSCGGMMTETSPFPTYSSYASSVVNAASNLTKAFSFWGESVVSSFSSSPKLKHLISSISHPGIVTVLDLTKLPKNSEFEIEDADAVLAHFIAHNEHIGYMKFGHGGRILLTSGKSSTCFHVFLLHPHPGSPSLGAVQHIYTLNRGNTPAKVVSCAFSMDNRFVALATNHGTTHLFAICPYGGPISIRTHGGKLVNKDSRYHRSSGLENPDIILLNEPLDLRNYQFGAPKIYKDHPSLVKPCVALSARNPCIGPYANPLGLTASAKLRDSLSVDNLSAWASDIAAPLTTSKKRSASGSKSNEHNRLSVIFASNSVFSDKTTLLVARADGLVTEYVVDVVPKEILSAPELDVRSLSHTPSNWQVPIKCELHGSVFWQLQRIPISDMRLPLSEYNPFLLWLKTPRIVTRRDSSDERTEAWMSQIEVFTYSEPHRCLWKLPQFHFTVFQSETKTADLIVPSKNKPKRSFKSVPVVIEASSSLSRSYEVYESVYEGLRNF